MNSKLLSSKRFWLVLATAGLAGASYVAGASLQAGVGFPLDDAWIHQTYARNLAVYHEWAFVPGKISGGSTAPLWSVLLSIGYLLGTGPFAWTFLLGFGSLAGLAWTGQVWVDRLIGRPQKIPWAGLFLAGEWHLVWSAFSGMETISYGLTILGVFTLLAVEANGWLVGILIGISIWLRPDGITLLGPALWVAFFSFQSWRGRLKGGARIMIPAAGSVGLYLLFNQLTAGSWLPTTFFAKQAEYSSALTTPLTNRFFALAGLPLIGAGIILLPGIWVFSIKAWKEKNWVAISAILWWLGFTMVYALRLPVTYQYGRYLVPGMAVYFLAGIAGMQSWIERWGNLRQQKFAAEDGQTGRGKDFFNAGIRVIRLSWKAVLVTTWALFAVLGGLRYASDVGIINSEMVATARWIKLNTPADSIIAVHDIGAIGYYSNRSIIDLAGLVSPEVIPFIRNEPELASFLNRAHAEYLVTFPTWYETLARDKRLLFQTEGKFSPEAGGENMAVYAWP